MIILHESYDLDPASPEQVDAFIALAEKTLVPAAARLGARLIGAFRCDADWFAQLQQLFEFDDLAAYDAFRKRAGDDAEWQAFRSEAEKLAPAMRSQLLEPLGPVPAEKIHQAIAASEAKPVKIYSLAVLEVKPGRMDEFIALLGAGAAALPIAAAWRPVAGNPNQVIDLWADTLGHRPYSPALESMKAFFRPLREVAPKERLVSWAALPYSPLR